MTSELKLSYPSSWEEWESRVKNSVAISSCCLDIISTNIPKYDIVKDYIPMEDHVSQIRYKHMMYQIFISDHPSGRECIFTFSKQRGLNSTERKFNQQRSNAIIKNKKNKTNISVENKKYYDSKKVLAKTLIDILYDTLGVQNVDIKHILKMNKKELLMQYGLNDNDEVQSSSPSSFPFPDVQSSSLPFPDVSSSTSLPFPDDVESSTMPLSVMSSMDSTSNEPSNPFGSLPVSVVKDEPSFLFDSMNPDVIEFDIIIKGKVKHVANDENFFESIRKQRQIHEKNKNKTSIIRRNNKNKSIVDGKTTQVNKLDLHSFETETKQSYKPEWATEEFIKKTEEEFILIEKTFYKMLDEFKMTAPSDDWTQHCRDVFQIFIGCIMSAGTNDISLFNAIYALRKLDMLELKFLTKCNANDIKNMEALLLFVGYNYYSTIPSMIVSAARRIKKEFNGNIPNSPEILLTFYGIATKICTLVLNECLKEDNEEQITEKFGIVVDTHLKSAGPAKKWSITSTNPRIIAMSMESIFSPTLYTRLNTIIRGLRQICRKKIDRVSVFDFYKKNAPTVDIVPIVTGKLDIDDTSIVSTRQSRKRRCNAN